MLRFIDDLVGAIADLFKTVFTGLCYFLGGFVIVGMMFVLIIKAVSWIAQ
ncbi:hypothetical protein ACFOZY_06360 [Chungangia koreensis]|uniref:Uncharacterized protein n=1 Tax=Chungangia koreensis TaxID=752657 RepID=A0ABV8X4H0_9LACT